MVSARELVWVYRTRDHARRYSGREIGQSYKEDLGPNALILATDTEPEVGYLVLTDASVLEPAVLERYVSYRQEQQREEPHQIP